MMELTRGVEGRIFSLWRSGNNDLRKRTIYSNKVHKAPQGFWTSCLSGSAEETKVQVHG